MHDQIERTDHTDQRRLTDAQAQPEVIDLRAWPDSGHPTPPDLIDLRAHCDSPASDRPEADRPGTAQVVGGPVEYRSVLPPAVLSSKATTGPADPDHPGASVWVVTVLAVVASLVVILAVSQGPHPAAAVRPLPATLGEQLGLG